MSQKVNIPVICSNDFFSQYTDAELNDNSLTNNWERGKKTDNFIDPLYTVFNGDSSTKQLKNLENNSSPGRNLETYGVVGQSAAARKASARLNILSVEIESLLQNFSALVAQEQNGSADIYANEQQFLKQAVTSQYDFICPSKDTPTNQVGYQLSGNQDRLLSSANYAMQSPPQRQQRFRYTEETLKPKYYTAIVEFKRQRMQRYRCPMFISPGQYVIVDGDRGVDCGLLIYCAAIFPDGSKGRVEYIDGSDLEPEKIKQEPGTVRSIATNEDIKRLRNDNVKAEMEALQNCREIVKRKGLAMKVIDCEFQFDMQKITFYFQSPHAIDFRELASELFHMFGVRIWLKKVNEDPKISQRDNSQKINRAAKGYTEKTEVSRQEREYAPYGQIGLA